VVGTADGGAQLWKAAEGPYRAAGMPLTMIYVKDGKHAWLIKKPEFAALCAWLEQIAGDKLPDQKTVPYEPAGEKPAPPAAPEAPPDASGKKPAHTV
jgi:hypothetical protein